MFVLSIVEILDLKVDVALENSPKPVGLADLMEIKKNKVYLLLTFGSFIGSVVQGMPPSGGGGGNQEEVSLNLWLYGSSTGLISCILKQTTYELDVIKIELHNGTELVTFDGLRVKRFNKTVYVIDGNLHVLRDFDEKWDVQVNFAVEWLSNLEFLLKLIENSLNFTGFRWTFGAPSWETISLN